MSFDKKNIERKAVVLLGKEAGKSEARIADDLDISQATYYRRMRDGWPKEGIFALCYLLKCNLKDLDAVNHTVDDEVK